MKKIFSKSKRILTGVVGGVVLLAGIVMIPYPGPGWLVVFAGLGILATEFQWARRTLDYAKGKYDGWQDWLMRQHFWLKAVFWCLTFLVVVVTVWLLNGYGFTDEILHLHLPWLHSPLSFFH